MAASEGDAAAQLRELREQLAAERARAERLQEQVKALRQAAVSSVRKG